VLSEAGGRAVPSGRGAGGSAEDTTLAAVVSAGGAELSRLMDRVEGRMAALVGNHGSVLARSAGDTIEAGGKRLRPLLVCLAAGVPPPEAEGLVRAAVAVELVHAATLVHDDVLDGSALRRGRPTVVAVGGRTLATATGDLLFSRAFAELVQSQSVQAVRLLARASSELARGELMQREDVWNPEVSVGRYLERCRLKTGVLFRAACELGALEGSTRRAQALGAFGEQIGLAFQILDDVLDVSGPPERTGKPRGADLLDGTVTLPLIVARQRDPALSELALRTVSSAGVAARVCDQIAASGALEVSRAQALELVRAAKAALPSVPARQRAALELVADAAVERYA
jgi:geranylgeranyl pyrophosphate synthase